MGDLIVHVREKLYERDGTPQGEDNPVGVERVKQPRQKYT